MSKKFRAWDNVNNCMIKNADFMIDSLGRVYGYDRSDNLTSYDNATLYQWTGLTDIDGVEIYEGDIITFDEIVRDKPRKGLQFFIDSLDFFIECKVFMKNIKIVENINDKPDYIKK